MNVLFVDYRKSSTNLLYFFVGFCAQPICLFFLKVFGLYKSLLYNFIVFILRTCSGAAHVPDSISLVELASLADMLGLEGLKEVVEHALKQRHCHNFHRPCAGCCTGVVEVLPLAAAYGLDDLYQRCLQWITKYFAKVGNVVFWKILWFILLFLATFAYYKHFLGLYLWKTYQVCYIWDYIIVIIRKAFSYRMMFTKLAPIRKAKVMITCGRNVEIIFFFKIRE